MSAQPAASMRCMHTPEFVTDSNAHFCAGIAAFHRCSAFSHLYADFLRFSILSHSAACLRAPA